MLKNDEQSVEGSLFRLTYVLYNPILLHPYIHFQLFVSYVLFTTCFFLSPLSTFMTRKKRYLMQAAIPFVRIALSALLTVCIFIGTFGVQFKFVFDGTAVLWVYTYKETAVDADPVYFAQTTWDYFGCAAPFHLTSAALAMGVIGCASSLAAVATSALLLKAPINASLVLASRASCFLATLTIFVTLIIVIVIFKGTFCDGAFHLEDGWTPDYGFGFLVLSTMVTSLISILEIVAYVTRSGNVKGTTLDENAPLNK